MKRGTIKRGGPIRRVSRQQRNLISRDIIFRAQILKRDGGCVVRGYGECSGALECCHVKPKGKWPELRYDPVNVFMGCRRHHAWAHREAIGFKAWFRETYPTRAEVLNL